MMKRSHAVIGAAAGVAVAHATGASMVAGGSVAALAGLPPDVDHPHAAVGRLLPSPPGWWHRLTVTSSVSVCERSLADTPARGSSPCFWSRGRF